MSETVDTTTQQPATSGPTSDPDSSGILPLHPHSSAGSNATPRSSQPNVLSPTALNGAASPPHHIHSPVASTSLSAAATVNAGLQHEDSRHGSTGSLRNPIPSERRRRSSVRMSLSINDPALPGPGELAHTTHPGRERTPSSSFHSAGPHNPDSPTRHARAPSLGELHQELEQEQEAQVNRLLAMIRSQQAQISALTGGQATGAQGTAIDDSTDVSRSQTPAQPGSRSASRRPISTSRHPSHSQRVSHSPSPSIRPQHNSIPHGINTAIPLPAAALGSSGDESFGAGAGFGVPSSAVSASSVRDDAAFYQAETQNLTRENQMLKNRIRELERQLVGGDGNAHGQGGVHSPGAVHSPSLLHSESIAEGETGGEKEGV